MPDTQDCERTVHPFLREGNSECGEGECGYGRVLAEVRRGRREGGYGRALAEVRLPCSVSDIVCGVRGVTCLFGADPPVFFYLLCFSASLRTSSLLLSVAYLPSVLS